MVLTSESETVIRYNPWGYRMLYALSLLLFLIAAVIGLVGCMLISGAFGDADSITGVKMPTVVGTLLMAGLGVGIWMIGTRYSKIYVSIGAGGVRLRILRQRFFMWKLLPERSFAWDEISEIANNTYQNFASFNAGGESVTLNSWDSPSPAKVAELMATRKGVHLGRLPNRATGMTGGW